MNDLFSRLEARAPPPVAIHHLPKREERFLFRKIRDPYGIPDHKGRFLYEKFEAIFVKDVTKPERQFSLRERELFLSLLDDWFSKKRTYDEFARIVKLFEKFDKMTSLDHGDYFRAVGIE